MNRGQLKARLVSESHRTDLTTMLDQFVNDAEEIINHRFALELSTSVDGDINYVLADHYLLYLYPAMRSLCVHIKDFDEGIRWNELWVLEAKQMNVNNLEKNNWVNPDLWVRSEEQTAVALEIISGT